MSPHDRHDADTIDAKARARQLLTVKEYANLARQHPQSVDYRRIRTGRQVGVHHIEGSILLEPHDDADDDEEKRGRKHPFD